METMKFLMTDLGEATAACVSALESRGLEVTVCPRDGAQVLEKLLECRPRAVLLEVFMPGLDALAVKQRYEAQGGTAVFSPPARSRTRRRSRSCWRADLPFTMCAPLMSRFWPVGR